MNKLANELAERIEAEAKKYRGMPMALSGGIDSSTLASFIKPEFVVSVELPGGDKYNEIQYSKKFAEYLGIKQEILKPDETEYGEDNRLTRRVRGFLNKYAKGVEIVR